MQDHKKKYVVVTGAQRECIVGDERQTFPYRQGDLALLHTRITEFYADFERNTSGKFLSSRGTTGLLFDELYTRETMKIPLLVYYGRNATGGFMKVSWRDEEEYVMIHLKEREFTQIRGTTLEEVTEGMIKIYQEQDIDIRCTEDMFESAIRKQWYQLEGFETLIGDRIHEITNEVAREKIPDDEFEDHIRYLQEQRRSRTRGIIRRNRRPKRLR